jgi:hypothetical protein
VRAVGWRAGYTGLPRYAGLQWPAVVRAARAAPLILVISLIRIKSCGSAPSGDAESDADQKRNCAAEATPGPG